MTQKVVSLTLAAAIATAGTFTVGYPTGTDAGTFAGGTDHYVVAAGAKFVNGASTGVSLSFGTADITVTYNGATTLPAGTEVYVNLDVRGVEDEAAASLDGLNRTNGVNIAEGMVVHVNLGAPDTADANGVAESQGATTMSLDGALVSGGVATFDVPRNVVGAWTTTATATVTGTDIYGNTIVETSGSGTSMAGKKAFKTVTGIVMSTAVTGATFGTGDVLGLPVYVPSVAYLLAELEDDTAPTAGALVAGLAEGTVATATNADVRGTYDPNSACNGAKKFELVLALPDPEYVGVSQYAG